MATEHQKPIPAGDHKSFIFTFICVKLLLRGFKFVISGGKCILGMLYVTWLICVPLYLYFNYCNCSLKVHNDIDTKCHLLDTEMPVYASGPMFWKNFQFLETAEIYSNSCSTCLFNCPVSVCNILWFVTSTTNICVVIFTTRVTHIYCGWTLYQT